MVIVICFSYSIYSWYILGVEGKVAMTTAKVFMSGNSQAIRLPKEFRVEGDEVYIKKTKNSIVITMKEKREVFKDALNDVFGCCPDFDTSREKIKNKPREALLSMLKFSTASGKSTGTRLPRKSSHFWRIYALWTSTPMPLLCTQK